MSSQSVGGVGLYHDQVLSQINIALGQWGEAMAMTSSMSRVVPRKEDSP